MQTAKEDYTDAQHKILKGLKKRVDALLAAERASHGDDAAREDKALQDARDLVRLGQQQLSQLERQSDETYATDREGLTRTFALLEQVLAKQPGGGVVTHASEPHRPS